MSNYFVDFFFLIKLAFDSIFTSKHFKLHSVRASRMPKFALTDIVSKFTMSPMIEEPLDELLAAIDDQIKLAINEAEKLNKRKVDLQLKFE
jgi:hypothetical protein